MSILKSGSIAKSGHSTKNKKLQLNLSHTTSLLRHRDASNLSVKRSKLTLARLDYEHELNANKNLKLKTYSAGGSLVCPTNQVYSRSSNNNVNTNNTNSSASANSDEEQASEANTNSDANMNEYEASNLDAENGLSGDEYETHTNHHHHQNSNANNDFEDEEGPQEESADEFGTDECYEDYQDEDHMGNYVNSAVAPQYYSNNYRNQQQANHYQKNKKSMYFKGPKVSSPQLDSGFKNYMIRTMSEILSSQLNLTRKVDQCRENFVFISKKIKGTH